MADQGRLEFDPSDFPALVEVVDLPARSSHATAAAAFHALNPHVLRRVIELARGLKARGLKHYGIGAEFEILRFKALESTGDIYKLNNNYRAWYAREAMRVAPDLEGFFDTRVTPFDPDYRDRPVRQRRARRG